MRIDVGVWTRKKLIFYNPKKENLKEDSEYESHWLRFEKFMGEKKLLGTTTEDGRFLLTDVDFLMKGNTFYEWDKFEFRNV